MKYPFNTVYKRNNIVIRSKSKCKKFDFEKFIDEALESSEKEGIRFDFPRLIVNIENTTYEEKGLATGYSMYYTIEKSTGLCTDVKFVFVKGDVFQRGKEYI